MNVMIRTRETEEETAARMREVSQRFQAMATAICEQLPKHERAFVRSVLHARGQQDLEGYDARLNRLIEGVAMMVFGAASIAAGPDGDQASFDVIHGRWRKVVEETEAAEAALAQQIEREENGTQLQ